MQLGLGPLGAGNSLAWWSVLLVPRSVPVTQQHVTRKRRSGGQSSSGGLLMRRHADAMIAELAVPAPDSEPLHFPTEYAVGRLGQLKIIVWKLSCVYWRYTGGPLTALVPAAWLSALRC